MTVVDLRSDTVTTPTEGMRRAMAAADVGDDVYGEDPTVNRLQDHVAALFGRGAALFVPSGVMGTQVMLQALAPRGTEIICEADCHVVAFEAGAVAINGALQTRTVPGDRGRLTADLVRAALRPTSFPYTQQSLVTIEETTNLGGGAIHGVEEVGAIRNTAREGGLRLYIDGARIFNAIVATGATAEDYGSRCDGLSFCLSKGLGAPIGSVIVGDGEVIDVAKGYRRRLGGAMRQVGVLAAAGLYALDNHVDRLADDHANARRLGERLATDVPGSVDLDTVTTNMVYVRTGDRLATDVIAAAADDGVRMGAMGPNLLRLVTHLDVEADGIEHAADVVTRLLTAEG
jgi:threonine aldolase